jgi:hypothetical protein
MSAVIQAPPGEILGYQDRLPLSWRMPAEDDPQPAELLDEAQRVLDACAMLEETRHRGDDDDPVRAELERLHHKVNLTLEMLGSLLSARQPRPPAHPIWLSAEGLLWLGSDDRIAAGDRGLISLHLHRLLPRPLLLPAVIRHSGGGEISARFDPLNASCRSELERHVFLRHRRAVAGSRSPHGR